MSEFYQNYKKFAPVKPLPPPYARMAVCRGSKTKEEAVKNYILHRLIRPNFWSKTKPGRGTCILWTANITESGYGRVCIDAKQDGFKIHHIQAHRIAWTLVNEESISPTEMILHKCDVRACVNPDHLYKGDAKQNAKDFLERNFSWWVGIDSRTNASRKKNGIRVGCKCPCVCGAEDGGSLKSPLRF
jgi:hypothetical protein